MNIDEKLLLPIHEVLIKDMKLMLQRQHNELKVRFGVMTDEDRNGEIEMLVSSILHTKTLNDINDIMIEYGDIMNVYGDNGFREHTNILFTLDGTLNYVLTLLIKQNEDDKQLTHNPIYMGF
jgi:hypothetical protein|tara:strand:+ start:707 stop:1072 length:366 start_codon:yes stop_codon:yes gene_type:complete